MNRSHSPSQSSKRCVGVALGVLLLGLAAGARGAVAETTKKAHASVKKERESLNSYYTNEQSKLNALARNATNPNASAQAAKQRVALRKKWDKAIQARRSSAQAPRT